MDKSTSSSSESLQPFTEMPLCVVCEETSFAVGPFSRHHLCKRHMDVDRADAEKLQGTVKAELQPFSQGASIAALAEEQRMLSEQLGGLGQQFATVRQRLPQVLDQWETRAVERLTARLEAVQTCLRDCEDVASYEKELLAATEAGDLTEACNLALSMQLSVPDLHADFDQARRLRKEGETGATELLGLRQLQRLIGEDGARTREFAGTARPETRDIGITVAVDVYAGGGVSAPPLCGPIRFNRELTLEGGGRVECLAVWPAPPADIAADRRSGRLVSAEELDSVPLPHPCLVIAFNPESGRNYLLIVSLDGRLRLCFKCPIDFRHAVCGLQCRRQVLYIAQETVVTVTDFLGEKSRRIRPDVGFGPIRAMCSGGPDAPDLLFVSNGGNRIGRVSTVTGEFETVAVLANELPDARWRSLTAVLGGAEGVLLARDASADANEIHRIALGSQPRLLARHRVQGAGALHDLAVDQGSRRLFVGQETGCAVLALSASDGSLLQSVGTDGVGCRLDCPRCLTVVTTQEGHEQLVVADAGSRLVLFDLLVA